MTTKRCFKCLCVKEVDNFYKHSKMGDGRLGKCKECTKTDATKNRLKKIDAIRAYDRMRASMPHRVALRAKVVKQYCVDFPERKKANTAVSNAVRDGRLTPDPCWVCGMKAVAHHPDYDKPLDVVWLCQPHHKQTHALV